MSIQVIHREVIKLNLTGLYFQRGYFNFNTAQFTILFNILILFMQFHTLYSNSKVNKAEFALTLHLFIKNPTYWKLIQNEEVKQKVRTEQKDGE